MATENIIFENIKNMIASVRLKYNKGPYVKSVIDSFFSFENIVSKVCVLFLTDISIIKHDRV